MKRKRSIHVILPFMLVVLCLLNTGLSYPSFCSPEKKDGKNPKPAPAGDVLPASKAIVLERQLLRKTLHYLRVGELRKASETLSRLVELVPDEIEYRKLLHMTLRQIEADEWYRFQLRGVDQGWFAAPPAGTDSSP